MNKENARLIYELCLSTYGANKYNLKQILDWYDNKVSFWTERDYLVFLDKYKV